MTELEQSAHAKWAYFEALELSLATRLRRLYEDILGDWRHELDTAFYKNLAFSPAPTNEPPRWDPVKAMTAGVPELLIQDFETAADQVVEIVEDDLDDALVADYKDGWIWGVWELVASGVIDQEEAERLQAEILDETEQEDLPYPVPEDTDIRKWLLLVGVAGLAYSERLAQWRQLYGQRMQSWVRGSIISGQTLDDTKAGIDRLLDAFRSKIVGLGQNEAHRAFTGGNVASWHTVSPERMVGELWVARTDTTGNLDPLVCPICEAKHLTITTEQPVTHSHPACRCQKVPIILDAQDEDVGWTDLARALARARGTSGPTAQRSAGRSSPSGTR